MYSIISNNVCNMLLLLAVVGEIDDTTQDFTIFTHRKIDIGYNGDQVSHVIVAG